MSTHIVVTTPESVSQPAMHASFLGIMRGEFLKIARLFWLLLVLLTVVFVVGFLLGANQPTLKTDLQHTPLHFLYYSLESNLVVFRIFSGIFLLVLVSFTIGREYQYGTMRILLARGHECSWPIAHLWPERLAHLVPHRQHWLAHHERVNTGHPQ